MQAVNFYKYHGTGNDFVLIDQYQYPEYDLSDEQIGAICDRRFGVGADGLIILRKDESADFKMIYYNADGHESSMCGNGGRCIVRFAHDLGVINSRCTFTAIDGLHSGEVLDKVVKIDMINVEDSEQVEGHVILNTGSPHYVILSESDMTKEEFISLAKSIRHNDRFDQEGINVNAYSLINDDHLKGITFERGVEDITWSCGTGVVAMAMSHVLRSGLNGSFTVKVDNLGGELKVEFDHSDGKFSNVYLIGPATKVFEGTLEV